MKTTGTQYWTSPNTGATNASGFSGLPGGWRSNNYVDLGKLGAWWTTKSVDNSGLDFVLNYNDSKISVGSTSKSSGFSIRCIKDY
jgi:uncharacterized protein (TIGR02145 family)